MLIDSSLNHIAVAIDGELWVCGENTKGQLGLGDYINRKVFTKVYFYFESGIKSIICVKYKTIILTYSGKVYASGSNEHNLFSIEDVKNIKSFVKLDLEDIDDIYCPQKLESSFIAIKFNKLYIVGKWPYDADDSVGNQIINLECTHIYKVERLSGYIVILTDNGLWVYDFNKLDKIEIPENVVDIAGIFFKKIVLLLVKYPYGCIIHHMNVPQYNIKMLEYKVFVDPIMLNSDIYLYITLLDRANKKIYSIYDEITQISYIDIDENIMHLIHQNSNVLYITTDKVYYYSKYYKPHLGISENEYVGDGNSHIHPFLSTQPLDIFKQNSPIIRIKSAK